MTSWHAQPGLQLSRKEDSCEATAADTTGAELHESICPVQMNFRFLYLFLISQQNQSLRKRLKWPEIKEVCAIKLGKIQ